MSISTHLAPSGTGQPARSGGGSSLLKNASGWGLAIIVIAGSVIFLAGGRTHPAVGAGAEAGDFFLQFANTVHQTHGWHSMHMLILLGPLLWAIAAPALLDVIRPSVVISAARSALVLSGALWAVAFVLDGFGAPVYAEAIVSAGSPEAARSMMPAFKATAVMMSRLGLVSWVAGGLGMVALGGSLLAPGVRTRWRIAVGVSGIVIGVWPLIAALEGEYAGGPFVSRFWMANALIVALWYIALAFCAFERRR